MSNDVNDQLFLVGGKSGAGKSASLMNMPNPEGVMYLGTEAGKKLPFRSKFKEFKIVDPMQVEEGFAAAEAMPEIHTIVIDTLSFLMDQYESLYVLNSANTMKAWGDYAQYFKRLMQQHVAKSTKNVIFLAHVTDVMTEDAILETCVKVKGSIMNQGVEAYFSTVVAAKKVQLKDLKDNESDLLTITPQEEALGFKHVFQVQLTKKTVKERIRSPMGMWGPKEIYIDNDCAKVLARLEEYYA
ncbi:Sak4-like ssDNA annealing protein [Vibrio phage vB_VspP_pVa5]|uniref:N4 gp44 protein n=1 Tax=Vibrio phage vB_VspP_pVa5 TaxID=1913109 RepID=A0A1J0GV40_9CAUD|nr:Sak4-like ssDNA annealing protein [Vibrio phage vB_VspP_pVa5]APC46048.1 N4 gp44 protein [Vibrio phage vB_VspP_pVa5]